MKQQTSLLIAALLIFAVVTISTFAQNGKENKGKQNNKEQKQHSDKGNQKQKGNDNAGKKNDDKKSNRGNDDKNGKDNANNGRGNDRNNRDDGDDNGKYKMKDGYKWDNTSFGNRKDIRKNMEKVSVCHKFNNGNEPAVNLRVSEAALKAHLQHGDVMGECASVDDRNFSDAYLRKRGNYYEVVQTGQEQVLYSRSILDYAVERLTGARTQLTTLQRTNAPAADVERKRLLIIDLEQNVSLLQTLVGVTANLVADRWTN